MTREAGQRAAPGSASGAAPPVNIVQKSFWENEYYWSNVKLPCRADMTFTFDRSLARALATLAPVDHGESVLEIGCAPAKWLLFYAERFGARVCGIEYSDKGAQLSRENLAVAGVDGEVRASDFFEVEPEAHDLVVSIGFIEHFDEPMQVLARHLDFVMPGGRLAVVVPNFRGLNWMVQRLARPDYLAIHNTAAMRPALYRRFAEAYGLELLHLGYRGGFDPAIIALSREPLFSPRRAIPGAITLLESRFRSLAIAERMEHRWLSSYLLATYRVPA